MILRLRTLNRCCFLLTNIMMSAVTNVHSNAKLINSMVRYELEEIIKILRKLSKFQIVDGETFLISGWLNFTG